MLRYFGPNELTFFRNFNKIVVKVKLVRLVYLRFYKSLERVRPSPGSGGTELLTRGEVWTLRAGIFKHGVGCDKATNCSPGGVLGDHRSLGDCSGCREPKDSALEVRGRQNGPRKDAVGTSDEM